MTCPPLEGFRERYLRLVADALGNVKKRLAAPLSCNTAAKIASQVLGFPIRYQPVSGADYKASLSVHGVSDAMGQSLVEMFEAIAIGQDMAAPAADKADCPTTLQAWMETSFKGSVAQIRSSTSVRAVS